MFFRLETPRLAGLSLIGTNSPTAVITKSIIIMMERKLKNYFTNYDKMLNHIICWSTANSDNIFFDRTFVRLEN